MKVKSMREHFMNYTRLASPLYSLSSIHSRNPTYSAAKCRTGPWSLLLIWDKCQWMDWESLARPELEPWSTRRTHVGTKLAWCCLSGSPAFLHCSLPVIMLPGCDHHHTPFLLGVTCFYLFKKIMSGELLNK